MSVSVSVSVSMNVSLGVGVGESMSLDIGGGWQLLRVHMMHRGRECKVHGMSA